MNPQRLVPDEPFPAYAFVPGRSPHPTSDPRGHSFGGEPAAPARLDPRRWWESRTYLFGLDLFNAGYYWESHVQLEGLWLAEGRTGTVADFLKALIKLAAAGVKHREGTPAGVRSHGGRAAVLLRGVASTLDEDHHLFLGLKVAELIELADRAHRHGWPRVAPVLLPARSTA